MVDQILQIPSAFRLILALFEPEELNFALTISVSAVLSPMSQVLLLQASLDSSLPMTNKPAGDGSSEYVPNPSTGGLAN